MKAALYARVSSERQADRDLSIPAQLKSLKKHALERGWDVVAEYVDEAESARTANRPKCKEMVAAARRRTQPFEVILVWKLSRFARNREDSVIYKSLLRKHGVQVMSINEPVDDSAAGKLLEGMIEVIDDFYCTNLAEDVSRGLAENAAKGFFNGGCLPFGYRRRRMNIGAAQKSKLEPDDTQAQTVVRVFREALAGQGGKEIAKALNRDGIRTTLGKLWTSNAINKIIRNEVYTGTIICRSRNGDVVRCPDAHPALVSKDDFTKVQKALAERSPKIRHPRTVTSRYFSVLCCTVPHAVCR
jgi:site-specific DNA recombinase